MAHEPARTPTPLGYHDGRPPPTRSRRHAEAGVLATVLASLALACASVPWGLLALVRIERSAGAGAGGLACVAIVASAMTLVFFALWATSERPGPPAIAAIALGSVVMFWLLAIGGAFG